MIGYVTLGTNDFDKAAAFYDTVLAVMGGKRTMEGENFIAWGNSPTQAAVSIIKPFDGNAACVGNGMMVALAVNSHELVDQVYAKALDAGGTDEGAPGERFPGFYAGYFRDLDGNKLNAFCMSPRAQD